jgi:hypothetical protein
MKLSRFLSELRDEGDCGVVYTHQLSDKHSNGSAASRMLGSTLLHGWCESALFTRRTAGGLFTVEVDALREMGEEQKLSVQGNGVGSWYLAIKAQDAEDATGREAPRVAEKLTKIERLQTLEAEEPGLSAAQYADRLKGIGEGQRVHHQALAAGSRRSACVARPLIARTGGPKRTAGARPGGGRRRRSHSSGPLAFVHEWDLPSVVRSTRSTRLLTSGPRNAPRTP